MSLSQSPGAYNQRAIALRAAGRHDEGLATFAEGVERFPDVGVLRANYAHALYESGATARAVEQYERLLHDDAHALAARFALYELLQLVGRRDEALAHQLEALASQSLFSSYAPEERRRVLLLATPGDLQANIPIDFVLDRQTTTVHRLYLLDRHLIDAQQVPPYDVIWNIIAESPESRNALALARDYLEARSHVPAINRPERVLMTARDELVSTLSQSGAWIAPIARVDRQTLADRELPYGYPSIVRPLGSHAGIGLRKICSDSEREQYVRDVSAQEYYISPFVDYSNEDGYFRKYRIIFVDGTPYPCHLAISRDWMIHYYNAPMAEHAWMRDEEERFLGNIWSVFGEHRSVLGRVAAEIGLEYFGIDATIDQNGRLFIFEADPAMVVHTQDSAELFPYKHRYIPNIFRAVEAMLDSRRIADT